VAAASVRGTVVGYSNVSARVFKTVRVVYANLGHCRTLPGQWAAADIRAEVPDCNHEAEQGIRRVAEAAGGNDCNRRDSEVAEVAAGGTTGRGSRRTKVVGGGASVVAEGRIAGVEDTPEAPNRADNKTSLEGKKGRKLGEGNSKGNTGSGVRRSEATQIGCRL
jgi:hypothetical protein